MTQRSYAKVNIFLKILGTRGSYHELTSRFVRLESLFDTITFVKKEQTNNDFELEGNFSCTLEKNSIYKAYLLLLQYQYNIQLEKFFHEHKVIVDKNIPEFAGLGGGSSNAATFLRLVNEILNLEHSKETLAMIGEKIGADVPFFIYNYPSANVSGIGEIVEPFEEELVKIETFTPDILCDTGKVYHKFRTQYLDKLDIKSAQALKYKNSKDILEAYDSYFLNDLFAPALEIYPELSRYHDSNFFSGSGSTFFKASHG